MPSKPKYKIIDNVLTEEEFQKIETFLTGANIAWYFQKDIAKKNETTDDFYFTHMFYKDYETRSDKISLLQPILNILNPKALIRIKGNLYPNLGKMIVNGIHTDYPFKHNGALFYINTNNGHTILEDGTKIQSKKNRLLLFDSSKKHRSTHCTDQMMRININFNYF